MRKTGWKVWLAHVVSCHPLSCHPLAPCSHVFITLLLCSSHRSLSFHIMLLERFSNEIIFDVAEKLDLKDFASFMRTNRHLHQLLHSFFYRIAARLVMLRSTHISVLHWAAAHGHERVVRWLLERGADPAFHDRMGITALHFAASAARENVVVIRLLLQGGTSFIIRGCHKSTALHLAVKNGYAETVKLLLQQAVGVERVAIFAKDIVGVNPLHIAAVEGYEPVVRLLLEHGANIAGTTNQAHGEYTALHLACREGNEAVVALLLEKGADPNSHSGYQKGFRSTPLHWVANSCYQIVSLGRGRPHHLAKLLLEMGANIMATDMHGRTPFHWLAKSSFYVLPPALDNEAQRIRDRLARMLLKKGTDINARDHRGHTALHLAVGRCEENLVQTFLTCGADREITDYTGKTAFQLAMAMGYTNIVDLFSESYTDKW